MLWISSDGTNLITISPEQFGLPHTALMGVAAIDDGYLAIGITEDDAGMTASSAVWTSADGTERTAVSGSTGIFEPKGAVISTVNYRHHRGSREQGPSDPHLRRIRH